MYKLHLMICLMKPFNNAISYIFAHQYANCGVVGRTHKDFISKNQISLYFENYEEYLNLLLNKCFF